MPRQSIAGGPALGLALLSLSFGPSLAGACAPRATSSALAPQPVELPIQPPAFEDASCAEPSAELEGTTTDDDDEDTGPPALPVSWSSMYGHTRPFVIAIQVARDSKRAFETAARAVVTGSDGGAPGARQFERANALLDLTSRGFAGAYHAPDAGAPDRLEALREAADLLLGWSRRLDEAGLARAPAAYRSDSSIALTFEDVANGPAKRWREEGLALVHLCVQSARSSGVDSAATRDCATMRQRYVRVVARRPTTARDSGATACACDPGDPLCSASMSGWCRPD